MTPNGQNYNIVHNIVYTMLPYLASNHYGSSKAPNALVGGVISLIHKLSCRSCKRNIFLHCCYSYCHLYKLYDLLINFHRRQNSLPPSPFSRSSPSFPFLTAISPSPPASFVWGQILFPKVYLRCNGLS